MIAELEKSKIAFGKIGAMKTIIVSYDGTTWEPIDRQKAIRRLEGFWKTETIESMLADGQTLHTAFALYKEVE